MKKYSLTFWQKVFLPITWLWWAMYPYMAGEENVDKRLESRKSWHEVKKRMEPHEHTFGEVYLYKGYKFRNCTHEGCNLASTKDDNGKWLDPL